MTAQSWGRRKDTNRPYPKSFSAKFDKGNLGFRHVKDYAGLVLWVSKGGRQYLIGRDEGLRTTVDNLMYAAKIDACLAALPAADTADITYVIVAPQSPHSGELTRGMLPPEIYDPMGRRAVLAFLGKYDGTGSFPKYGLLFGSEVWEENKENLPHVVAHEVGHLDYYKRGEAYRDVLNDRYQAAAEAFIETNDSRIEHVARGGDGRIIRIDGLSNIYFRPDMWAGFRAPSVYSMKAPSEYHAELYAHGLVEEAMK